MWPGGVWTILRRAVAEARDDGVPMLAQALAYALFLAIPGILLVTLGVFSLVADASDVARLVGRFENVIPEEAMTLLEDSLSRSASSAGQGVLLTVVGFLLALWSTTSAATTLMDGLTRAYDREDDRTFLRKRLEALAIVAALLVAVALVLGLLVLGPHLERWAGEAIGAETVTAWTWWTAQWPILIGGLLMAFAVVLAIGPAGAERHWRFITPGALVAVLLWLVASAGFALFASRFGNYEKTWGTLAGVVVTLVWLWLTGAALLFGAEVNAEVERAADGNAARARDERASDGVRRPEAPRSRV
ncbi:MAG TPA: YihY/virulence factor BrkB family protein [Gaiellaceae bacterium]|nr:YihY/virulence factor BrkB family protein [Gaiellaceae bacterium]